MCDCEPDPERDSEPLTVGGSEGELLTLTEAEVLALALAVVDADIVALWLPDAHSVGESDAVVEGDDEGDAGGLPERGPDAVVLCVAESEALGLSLTEGVTESE